MCVFQCKRRASLAVIVGGHVARDGEQPRRKRPLDAAIPAAAAPRLFKGGGRQVFGDGIVANPVAHKVVDARQVIGVQGVPIDCLCRI